nr:MAG TPA_asm: hypothetical protein [Caudoviricetes sp.]
MTLVRRKPNEQPCCTRGRVAPGQCETVRHGSHGNDNVR